FKTIFGSIISIFSTVVVSSSLSLCSSIYQQMEQEAALQNDISTDVKILMMEPRFAGIYQVANDFDLITICLIVNHITVGVKPGRLPIKFTWSLTISLFKLLLVTPMSDTALRN
ncbi:hypothetical protein L9F63_020002, partial [Diploptera punctata]